MTTKATITYQRAYSPGTKPIKALELLFARGGRVIRHDCSSMEKSGLTLLAKRGIVRCGIDHVYGFDPNPACIDWARQFVPWFVVVDGRDNSTAGFPSPWKSHIEDDVHQMNRREGWDRFRVDQHADR